MMAFSMAAAKRAMSLVFLTAVVSVALSGHKAEASNGKILNMSLPSDIPVALTNFTDGHGKFSNFLVGLLLGVGHQVYTYNGTTWVNSNVSAVLYDDKLTTVAHHFFLAPPGINGGVATWATVSPPSRVTAAAAVKIPQNTAVPLLLLKATGNSGPTNSSGSFRDVTNVQRLQTIGGVPPTTNTTIGTVFNSPYSALYAFYTVP